MGEEATSVDVEPRVSDSQAEHSATDLIRSMALSSAELWHDVLQRLAEVQESQVILAQAVAEIGAAVKSLSTALPALNGGTAAALGVAPGHPSVPSGPLPRLDPFGPNGVRPNLTADAIAVAGLDDQQGDLVGPLPADVIAAFFPPETEVAPWYKRRVSLRLRRRRHEAAPSTFEADWPQLPQPVSQVLPPPPPQHLLDQYLGATTAQVDPVTAPEPASAAEPVAAAAPESPFEPAEVSDLVAAFTSLAKLGPETVHEELLLDAPVATAEPTLEPAPEPAGQTPFAPRALVYTPSNAETAIPLEAVEPFALDEPAPEQGVATAPEPLSPVAIPFELDPPQDLPVQSAAVTTSVVPEATVTPAASAPPAPPEISEAPEPALVGVVGGRPVVEAQMSVSMATEILGSAAAAAPAVPSSPNSEPAPLVISEDLTIVSKHHRNRKRLQFRLR